MGYMIEISEGKANKLSEHIEESLKHLGKAMQCVSEMTEDGFGFGERNRPSNRYGDAMTRYGAADTRDTAMTTTNGTVTI